MMNVYRMLIGSLFTLSLVGVTTSCGQKPSSSELKDEPKSIYLKDFTIEKTGTEGDCSIENEACKKPVVVKFKQNRDTNVKVENAVLVFELGTGKDMVTFTVNAADLNGAYGNDGEKSQKLNLLKIKATKGEEKEEKEIDLSKANLVKIKFKAATTNIVGARGKLEVHVTPKN